MNTRSKKTTKRQVARTVTTVRSGAKAKSIDTKPMTASDEYEDIHLLGAGRVCRTDERGYAMPDNADPLQHKLHISSGFVALWTRDVVLRWRFNEPSVARFFSDAEAGKAKIRGLFVEALNAWGGSSPIGFAESDDVWDFEIVMRRNDDCDASGCVLASAFFPDGGRHSLDIYPKLFTQSPKEQVDTLIHELGHIFGLRHFFADVAETNFPWAQYGSNESFTIMNYGALSELTNADRNDLRELYLRAWSGELQQINGTRLALVQPYHRLLQNSHGTRVVDYMSKMTDAEARLGGCGCGCRNVRA